MSLPVNPYIAGAPLRGNNGFFGRQNTLEWVGRELRNPQTNALVIFGQRRIGKTTLLLQLARNLSQEEFLPVYFDLQDQATRPLGQTLKDLAEILCEKANLDLGPLEPFDDGGRYFQKDFLPRFYAALGEQRRPVFLLDEFDVLDQTAEAALLETATAKALFPLLRRLITSDGRSAFVFVVGRRAEDLSIDFNATFKASLVREVWVLDKKSAETLVCQAEANGTLNFTADAVQRILSLTNYHPYLTQLLCQRIWELAYTQSPSSVPTIDSAQVEAALESSLQAGNQALDWLWNGLNPAEKIYASALAAIAGENETIPEERIIEVLATHAARLRTREIELAPRDLVKRHVLDHSTEDGYRFAVEVFRRWVHKNKPLLVVKDEVDRIDPMADRLFVIGDGFYDARQWKKAENYFREALDVNPRHFRARLYLGETLLEQARVEDAISELEQALILDREEARLPLARAWLAKAELLKVEGDLDLLFQAYESVLELSPKESQAIQGRKSVWLQRAKLAEESGDLTKALEAYQQIGDQENIDRVNKIERGRLLGELQAQAQQHAEARRWEAAQSVYAHMVELSPDEASRLTWQRELEKAQQQVTEEQEEAKRLSVAEMKSHAQAHGQRGEWEKVIQIYEKLLELEGRETWSPYLEAARRQQEMIAIFQQGRQALRQEEWKEAQRLFAQVIQVRPDFRRDGELAAALLLDAIAHRKGLINKLARLIRHYSNNIAWFLVAAVLLTGLLLSISGGIGIYSYLQKPLAAGDTESGIPASSEAITAANALRLDKIGGWFYSWDSRGAANAIALSPDSTSLAVALHHGLKASGEYAAIVQIESGSVQQVFYGHSAAINDLSFSPDGSLLATGSDDKTINLWDVKTTELVHTLQGHTDGVKSVAFSPDGSLLASASADSTLRIWNVGDGSVSKTLEGHTGTVNKVMFSPDGSLLASASDDSTVSIWDVVDGSLRHTLKAHSDIVRSVGFSPDGALLASISDDGTVHLWQVSDGSLVQTIQFASSSDFVYAADITFSADGNLLVPVSSDGVGIWQLSDGEPLFPPTSSASRVLVSQDGKLLVTVSGLDSVEFWNIREAQVQSTTPTPFAALVQSTEASVTEAATEAPATEAPATEAAVAPTRTAIPQAQQFFKEEFSSEDALSNWQTFNMGPGAGEDVSPLIQQEANHLLFDLKHESLYVYYMYTPFEYEDVSIKLNAENLGRNNNNVSLICRMDPNVTQWYEFSVESGGLWYLYAFRGDDYNVIINGGTQQLKQGHEINEYGMTCRGPEITLFVNGQEITSIIETKYAFESGQVGFNISSLNVLPITVAVNWFEIRR